MNSNFITTSVGSLLSWLLAGCVCVFASSALAVDNAQATIEAEIAPAGEASHLVFKGRDSWKYDVQKTGSDIKVLVPKLSAKSAAVLKKYSDKLIKSVVVNERGLDNGSEIIFHLQSKKIDSFDYQTDQPTDLVVDFYTPDNMKADAADDAPALDLASKSQAGKASKSAKSAAKAENAVAAKSAKAGDRKPASSEFMKIAQNDVAVAAPSSSSARAVGSEKDLRHGIFDGGDPQFRRFSIEDYEIKDSALIASQANIYLHFPMLKLDSPHLKAILDAPPIYEIEPIVVDAKTKMTSELQAKIDENKEAQLLLTLAKNKRTAIFLKTAKQFLKTYPNSQYDEVIRSIEADTHYDFWLKDHSAPDYETALGLYRALSEKYPDSPLNTRNMLLIAYTYLDHGDNFGALKAFQRFLRLKPTSKAADQVKLSTGEAYMNLHRWDDAVAITDEVERTALSKKDRIEAAYRRGDIFFEQKDYARAAAEYAAAQKKFPEAMGDYPNAAFNKAEAQFWSKDYRSALPAYRDYLQKFPDHPHGGYAMDRIGEVLEILGAPAEKSLGAYLESGFRYQGTPGARVARVRVLSSRLPDMKEKEAKSAIEEIETIAKTTDLPDFAEFATFQKTDGMAASGDYGKATKELISYFQLHPNIGNKQKFESRIARYIAADIKEKVAQGDFIQALRTQSQYANSWLKNSGRIDTPYFTARAYEQAGVLKEARSMYQGILTQLTSLKPAELKERGVFESLPSVAAVRLRMAVMSSRNKDFSHAEAELKQIPDDAKLTESEQIERAQVAVDVAEARGQNEKAKNYLEALISGWKGQAGALADLQLRLAKLQLKSKDVKGAAASLATILQAKTSGQDVSEETHAHALEMKGDLELARGHHDEALASYRDLLKTYEAKRQLSSIRYKVGKILFDDGNTKQAATEWADLKNDQSGIWQKLADEQLQGAKWNGDYKKYMNRIPAMAPQASGSGSGSGAQ